MANEAPLTFSIIVPVYNGQHVVERCIASILKQNHQLFELILINDGSTDQTHQICQKYRNSDKRISYFKQYNKGVSSARNHGLRVAQNEYILFVDADDYLLPNFLSDFNSILNRDNLSNEVFIIQDFIAKIKLANGQEESYKWCKFNYGKYSLAETFEALRSMDWLNWGVPFARVYRNSIIKNNNLYFNEKMSFREDLIFMLEYMVKVKTLVFDPTANYCYTIDNTKISLSNTTSSFANELIFFNYSKQMAETYTNKFNLSSTAQAILYKMVYASFFRCINSCMYKHKIPMQRQERIENIKSLVTKNNLNLLLESGVIDSKVKYLAFALLRNRLYTLYDLMNSIRFSIS